MMKLCCLLQRESHFYCIIINMVASDVQNCLFSSINLFIFYTCTIGSHWKRTYLEVMLPTRIISASRLVTLCIVNFSELLLYYKIALVTWWSCCSLGTCWRFWSCHSVFSKRNGDLISKMVHCIAVLNVHFIFHKANRHCAVVYICLKVFSWVCQEKWSWGNKSCPYLVWSLTPIFVQNSRSVQCSPMLKGTPQCATITLLVLLMQVPADLCQCTGL